MKNNTPSSLISIWKQNPVRAFLQALLVLAGSCFITGLAHAQSTFTTTSGTTLAWGTAANWSPSGVPVNAANTAVLFNSPVGGNQAINSFGVARTVGYMTVTNDSANTFSITTINTLNFDVTTGNAALTVAGTGDNLTTFASTLNVVLNDSLDLSVTNTASTSADGALRISGVISGSGRIFKTGAGIATLTGTNTFAGGVTISAGTIRISGSLGVGATPTAYVADQVVINGGTLEYFGSGSTSAVNRGFALGSSIGTISAIGSGAYQIGGIISDVAGQAGVLRKTGAGTLYLNPDSASSFSGGTTIVSGTLQFGINGSVGTGAITLGSSGGGSATLESVRGGYTLANNITVASGSGGTLTLYYSGTGAFNSTFSGNITLNDSLTVRSDSISGQAMRLTGAISGSNNITKTGTGTLRLENNNTGYSGTITISAGTLQLGNVGTTGGIGSGAIVNNGTLVISRTNTLALTNDMSGSGTFVQAGTGVTTIANLGFINSYSGGTIISSGTLQAGRTGALGTGGVNLGSVGGGDATLESYLGGYTVANNIIVASDSGGTLTLYYSSTGLFNGTFSGTLTLNDNLVIRSDAATGFAMRITGAISGSTNITKTGVGVLRMEDNNTAYSGTTTISAGTLQLGSGGTTGGIGSGSMVNNAALLLQRSNALALGNQISGTGSLTQSGSGTTTLSNANTYSGGTTVNGGALMVTNTSGSATGTGSVTVTTALGGTGIISPTAASSVVLGGAVLPGVAGINNGVGTLTFTPVNGNVTFQSSSSIVFELSANHTNDKIVFAATGTGTLDLSAMTPGSMSVIFTGGYTPTLNASFDLLDWTSVIGLSDALLSLSTTGFDPSWRWDTTQFTTTGIITVISTVPEPSRLLFLACGLISIIVRRRRK